MWPLKTGFTVTAFGPVHEISVLISSASSERADESARGSQSYSADDQRYSSNHCKIPEVCVL